MLSHRPTHLAALAERAVSRALGGSCTMPLAAYATWDGAGRAMRLRAVLGHAETPTAPLLGAESTADVADADAAEALGAEVARALSAAGAGPYLRAAGVAAH
jgi:hydroxymethylbilane synthase